MAFEVYNKLVRVLKLKCPPAYPVSVRRVRLSGMDGDCTKHKGMFYIRISNELPEVGAIDTLLHEWAHARAWNHLHDNCDWDKFEEIAHDASWGVAYSEVYRVYEKEFLTEEETEGICRKVRPK